ncbi:hypothetical protein HGRIS_012478 [Hohenbuehelia grisea]|uniref:Cupin type-1 domain-containing protein n=1 Tax=Hohenbuehelia grisea TaxID=104357 RepID=A0ABR3ISE5_9AGAR
MSITASLDLQNEPDTISLGKGINMTFLRGSPYLTRTVITGEETLKVPLHWHLTHSEIHRVTKGRIKYTIGEPGARLPGSNKGSQTHTRILGPDDGELVVPPGTIHGLETFPGEESEVYESTDPMDEEKEVFFRNFVAAGGVNASPFALFQTFYWGDGYPVTPGGRRIEKFILTCFGYYLAPILGYKLKYDISKLKAT